MFDVDWIEKKCLMMLSDLPELNLAELKDGLDFCWALSQPPSLDDQDSSHSSSQVTPQLKQLESVLFESECERLYVLAHFLPPAFSELDILLALHLRSLTLATRRKLATHQEELFMGTQKELGVKMESVARCLIQVLSSHLTYPIHKLTSLSFQCIRWAISNAENKEEDIKTIGDLITALKCARQLVQPFTIIGRQSLTYLKEVSLQLGMLVLALL